MDAQDGHPSRFLTVSSKLKILTSDVSQPVTVVCSTYHYLNKIHWMGRILRDKENFTFGSEAKWKLGFKEDVQMQLAQIFSFIAITLESELLPFGVELRHSLS